MQWKKITFDSIIMAQRRIAPFVRETPLVSLNGGICLKLENTHPIVNAFKIRGVWNRLLGEGALQVVTAAIGSHGFAVGTVCKKLGKKSTCFMPRNAPEEKKEKMMKMSDSVVFVEGEFADVEKAAEGYAKSIGSPFIHPYNDPAIIAGQGTIGLELFPVNELSRVYVPVGGGGLIAGIGLALKECRSMSGRRLNAKVIGVQPEAMHAMKTSLDAGKITYVPSARSLAEPLCVNPHPHTQTFDYIREYVDEIVTVPEERILAAMLLIYERTGHLVEGAGAIAAAAALTDARKERILDGRWVCIATGGNISEERFQRDVLDSTIRTWDFF